MLRLAIVFLVIAMLAALSGFGVISAIAWDGARIFFFIFLVLAVLSLIFGGLGGRRIDTVYAPRPPYRPAAASGGELTPRGRGRFRAHSR